VRLLAGVAWVGLLAASCSLITSTPNGPYDVSISDGLQPRMRADDAVWITLTYLARQTPEIAAPELHVEPHVAQVWAVRASEVRNLDGCAPRQTSTDIVWVTKGVGDYLNLHDLPWSHGSEQSDDPWVLACEGPGPAGTIVIDDATGSVLGVYPSVGDEFPHPTGPLPSRTETPIVVLEPRTGAG
jgi:hypothetical protein